MRTDREAVRAELGADDGARIVETAAKWAVIGLAVKWIVIGGALVLATRAATRGR